MTQSIDVGPLVDAAVVALKRGDIVAVADDVARVPRSFLLLPAAGATASAVNQLVTLARGVVCVGITYSRAVELGLHEGTVEGNEHAGCFTRSVEARLGVSTGISAGDRAATVNALAAPSMGPDDFVSPGHIFPVIAHAQGVLGRPGEAEVAVDLLRLAGLPAVGAYCHVLSEDGNLAGPAELSEVAQDNGLVCLRSSALLRFRMESESFVQPGPEQRVETPWGAFRLVVFRNELDGAAHPVLLHGDLSASSHAGDAPAPLVRVHSQCLTGDVFASLRCDCGDQLAGALSQIAAAQAGALIYLRQEGRGIGLVNKIRAYALQDRGKDTVDANLALGFPADQRSFVVAAQILKRLGASRVRLVTNNPRKIKELEQMGVHVTERVVQSPIRRPENARYLDVKAERLGHLLEG